MSSWDLFPQCGRILLELFINQLVFSPSEIIWCPLQICPPHWSHRGPDLAQSGSYYIRPQFELFVLTVAQESSVYIIPSEHKVNELYFVFPIMTLDWFPSEIWWMSHNMLQWFAVNSTGEYIPPRDLNANNIPRATKNNHWQPCQGGGKHARETGRKKKQSSLTLWEMLQISCTCPRKQTLKWGTWDRHLVHHLVSAGKRLPQAFPIYISPTLN